LVLTTLFVAVRIFANPISNVSQKQLAQRSAHPVFIITSVFGVLAAISAILCVLFGPISIPPDVWTTMVVAATLAVTGNVLLVYALRDTDLSVLGPINAYKSLVSLVLGFFLIGERPTPMGLAGVLLIVAGSYFVVDKSASHAVGSAFARFFKARGIRFRFAALFVSATEAVFLKRALVASSPITVFVLWSGLGVPIALGVSLAVLRGDIARQVRLLGRNVGTYAFLAFTTGVMQLATLLTFRDMQVGYSLALFQLSAVVSVVLGRRFFGEGHLRERLVGALCMAAGAALIVTLGRGE
jgi:drug/metabolite transporter (DMT)-like permease